MRALMWFRADLRCADNTALREASCVADEGVVAVFTICPQQWKEHDWGAMRVDFVLRNLRVLGQNLAELNIPLRVLTCARFVDVPKQLLELAQELDCSALYYNIEYEVNELARDQQVEVLLRAHDIEARSFHDQTCFDLTKLRTGTGGFYTVFTPFKKKWIERYRSRELLEGRPMPQQQHPMSMVSDDVPKMLDAFEGHTRPDLWIAGEQAAIEQLERFVESRSRSYKVDRDIPALNGTSLLSPYLAVGALSPRQCVTAGIAANGGSIEGHSDGVATWLSEIIWREFYRHVLIGFPRVCRNEPFKERTAAIRWSTERALFDSWCAGRTGVPIVDAGMRQLNQSGWMHNRVRMIVAMYLTKNLFIDWRMGERYFMNRLVDGDFASNNGGWQWSASTGTDAAPYFRMFNPFSQALKFDPEADYIRKFVTELKDAPTEIIHDASASRADWGYPEPLVDHRAARAHVMATFKGLS